jgi:ABC-type Fe3+ transport system permease subunit
MSYPPPDYGYATVVSVTLVAATGLGLFAQRWLMRNKCYVAIGGRSHRPANLPLRRWKAPVTFAFALFLVIAVLRRSRR